MTVYVVQQPRPNKKGWTPDLSSASEYGNLFYIFEPNEKVFALPGPSLFKARKILRERFNENEDYILWPSAGDPMAFACLMLALGELNLHEVNFLVWDRKRRGGVRVENAGFYVPTKFKLREKKDEDS